MATRQEELQALIDLIAAALTALNDAFKPVLALLSNLPKVEAQAAQLPQYEAKFEALKQHIRQQDEALKAKDGLIAQFMAQTKEGRLAAMEAQAAKLAALIAAEKAPPPEEKPADETAPETKEVP